jgi:hypothetical protein
MYENVTQIVKLKTRNEFDPTHPGVTNSFRPERKKGVTNSLRPKMKKGVTNSLRPKMEKGVTSSLCPVMKMGVCVDFQKKSN